MLANALKELQSVKKQLVAKISQLDSAIKALSGLSGGGAVSKPVKRTMSPAHRRAIIKAQKARWAKHNAGKATVAKPAKKKFKMSAAAKAKLSAFQKARWAKIKAAKTK